MMIRSHRLHHTRHLPLPVFFACLVLLAGVLPVAADDWPQWRGPERNGKSAETGLIDHWPEGGPPLVWKADGLGRGYSSVAVVGDRIVTLGDLEDGQYVLAVSRDGGERLWATKIGPVWENEFPGSRSTPTVDGDRVYALGTEGDLLCLSLADGKVHWRRHLEKDFGGALMLAQGKVHWKWSESPLVDGDRVIVTPGGEEAAVVALDKATGKELWRTAVPALEGEGISGAAYSSAVISEGAGRRQIVQLVGHGAIGLDADSGRYLWGYGRVANPIANIATPIIDGDRVFVSTGYGTGSALLQLEKAEQGVAAREIYFLDPKTMQNHHGGLILHEGHVYTGTGHNKGFPLAVEMASGEVAWGPERNAGRDSAAIIFAEGHLYFRYQNGLMLMVEATPEGYREKGSFMIPDIAQFSWSHPAISNGQLILREQGNLYVHDLKPRPEPKAGP